MVCRPVIIDGFGEPVDLNLARCHLPLVGFAAFVEAIDLVGGLLAYRADSEEPITCHPDGVQWGRQTACACAHLIVDEIPLRCVKHSHGILKMPSDLRYGVAANHFV